MNACKPYIQNVKWPNSHAKIATLPSLPPVAAGAPSSPVIQAVQVAIQKLCLVEQCQLACIAMSIHIFMISCMCTMYSCKCV